MNEKPVAQLGWDVVVENGAVRLKLGNQMFTIDYYPPYYGEVSEEKQLEWMAEMLRKGMVTMLQHYIDEGGS